MESNAYFISPAEAISDLRKRVESRFDADSPIRKDLLKAIDVVAVTLKSSCNESDRRYEELEAKHVEELRIREEEFKAKIEEVRYQCKEELQDHIDDLTEELAACKEDSAADRVTIQHLVAVVAKLVK
jgi:hypothetical protein